MKRFYAILVFGLAFTVSGCVISPRRTLGGPGTPGNPVTPGTGGQLYISTSNSILRFSNAEVVNGNTAPTATITSSAFSSPQHIVVDTTNDRLYVANRGGRSILVFDNASTLTTGNVTPTRIISGASTGFANPIDVAIDTINDLLYVADGTTILLFARASTDNGNLQPTTINMGITIGGLLLDAANDQLYVSDPADNVVDRLDNASGQTTVGIVGGAIAGPDTLLSQPRGLALDGSGRLLVGNSAAPISITTYGSAGVATGDVVPFANISGSNTQLQSPQQMVLNGNILNGELYVVDPVAASILIYTNTSTVTGNLTPARVINGANTGLAVNGINGIALDTTR